MDLIIGMTYKRKQAAADKPHNLAIINNLREPLVGSHSVQPSHVEVVYAGEPMADAQWYKSSEFKRMFTYTTDRGGRPAIHGNG